MSLEPGDFIKVLTFLYNTAIIGLVRRKAGNE